MSSFSTVSSTRKTSTFNAWYEHFSRAIAMPTFRRRFASVTSCTISSCFFTDRSTFASLFIRNVFSFALNMEVSLE